MGRRLTFSKDEGWFNPVLIIVEKLCMHEKLHPKPIPMVGNNIKSSLVRKMSWVPQYKMGIWDQIIRKELSNLLPVNQTQAFFLEHILIPKLHSIQYGLQYFVWMRNDPDWEQTRYITLNRNGLLTHHTMCTQVTTLKKAGMGPSPGIFGMELPFPSL